MPFVDMARNWLRNSRAAPSSNNITTAIYYRKRKKKKKNKGKGNTPECHEK